MYAVGKKRRKSMKLRDQRRDKTQNIEYDFLAPDSINEVFDSIYLLKKFTGTGICQKTK
jgi:hypothetical protein